MYPHTALKVSFYQILWDWKKFCINMRVKYIQALQKYQWMLFQVNLFFMIEDHFNASCFLKAINIFKIKSFCQASFTLSNRVHFFALKLKTVLVVFQQLEWLPANSWVETQSKNKSKLFCLSSVVSIFISTLFNATKVKQPTFSTFSCVVRVLCCVFLCFYDRCQVVCCYD